MSEFWDDLQEVAVELIGEFGQPVVITSEDTGDYVPGGDADDATTTQTGTGLVRDWRTGAIDGTLIQVGDKRLLLGPRKADGTAIDPQAEALANLASGEKWRIKNVWTKSPAGTVLYFVLNLRKG